MWVFGTESALAIRCDDYADRIVSNRPVDTFTQEWAYDSLYEAYFVECMVTMSEAPPLVASTINAASKIFNDLASGYGEQSATIKKDLIELKTSLKGLRQWFVWWARTKNGGQAAAESLGRLNKIIKTIEDGNPRPNQSESP
jgi:hypothetical protein